jgi:hypothetical protein
MRRPALPFFQLLAASALAVPALSYAEPGSLWEIGVEMEGMPFAMPKQKVCSPKASKEPPVTQNDGECKMLEKKQSGNRFQWKAQCKEGTMVGDITSTPTSYNGMMTVTENSGQTMSMKMAGKRLGDCDYQDRSGEVKATQKQSEAMMARTCQESLEKMQMGIITSGACPKEKPIYCQRLATPEGYDKATRHLPADMHADPAAGLSAEIKACGQDSAKLLPRLCASAVSSSNYDFVGRLCPGDKSKLCGKAVAADQVGFVAVNCPAEKVALLKRHCEGRAYSSQIEQKYRAFCAGAASGEFADDGSAASGRASADKAKGQSGDLAIPTDLEQGVKKLKGLFGF